MKVAALSANPDEKENEWRRKLKKNNIVAISEHLVNLELGTYVMKENKMLKFYFSFFLLSPLIRSASAK